LRDRVDPSFFEVKTATQLRRTSDSITSSATFALIGVVAISVLLSGVSVTNNMVVSVTERTREVGVAKSPGETRFDVLIQFLSESLIMCCAGGLAGVCAGILLVLAMSTVFFSVDVSATPYWAYGISVAFFMGVGVIFGVIPALKAANLEPVEALRYE